LSEALGEDLRPSSEFWKNFFIRTSGKDLYLNIEDPIDELRYLFLKNHKRVKNSLTEQKATANFVLLNKDEEARRSNVYNKIKRKAASEFDKLSHEDMRKCLRLYGHNGDTLSNEVVENRLSDLVEGNPQAFLDRWVNNKQRDNEVLIERAISKNIIRRNKNIYKYGTEIIGHSLFDASAFMADPKNQDIKIAVLNQLDSKDTMGEHRVEAPVDIEEKTKSTIKTGPNVRTETPDVVEEVVEAKKAKSPKVKKGDTI
jgi:hypothetical protein